MSLHLCLPLLQIRLVFGKVGLASGQVGPLPFLLLFLHPDLHTERRNHQYDGCDQQSQMHRLHAAVIPEDRTVAVLKPGDHLIAYKGRLITW